MCPSGSRKYIAAAGIHPITLGCSAGSPKRQRLDSLSMQALRSGQHVGERHVKGDVQLYADRCPADRPQAEHRAPRPTDPVKNRCALGRFKCHRQADDIAIERDRARQVSDRQVRLKQSTNAHRALSITVLRTAVNPGRSTACCCSAIGCTPKQPGATVTRRSSSRLVLLAQHAQRLLGEIVVVAPAHICQRPPAPRDPKARRPQQQLVQPHDGVVVGATGAAEIASQRRDLDPAAAPVNAAPHARDPPVESWRWMPPGALAGMRAHLTGCPACREDHESLLEFVATDDSSRAP